MNCHVKIGNNLFEGRIVKRLPFIVKVQFRAEENLYWEKWLPSWKVYIDLA